MTLLSCYTVFFFLFLPFPKFTAQSPWSVSAPQEVRLEGTAKCLLNQSFPHEMYGKDFTDIEARKNVVQYCLSGSIRKTEGNHWKINISSTNTHKIICLLFNIKWNIKIKYTFVHVLKNYGILHSLIKQVVLHDKNKWEEEDQNLQEDRSHGAGFACPSATSYGHTEPRVTG